MMWARCQLDTAADLTSRVGLNRLASRAVSFGWTRPEQIEVRIELQAHPADGHERFAEHDELARQAHLVAADQAGDLEKQRLRVEAMQRQAVVLLDELQEVVPQRVPIGRFAQGVHVGQDLDHDLRLAVERGDQGDDELAQPFLIDPPGKTEVDQSDSSRRFDQQIARMRVGMEEGRISKN